MRLLDEIDLNLLKLFDCLMLHRNVSKAAHALNLSQPAVSNGLARLRRQLQDELLVRTSAGMQPTPRALELAPAVADALLKLEQALDARQAFNPSTGHRNFRVAMSDIGEIYFLPVLTEWMANEAPGVTLNTVRSRDVDLRREMQDGRIDLAVGYLPDLSSGFYQRRLFVQRYVCIMREGHPLGATPITSAAFLKARHLIVAGDGTGHARLAELLARRGAAIQVQLHLPHFTAVPYIVSQTDLIASVPHKLAVRTAGPMKLQVWPHPLKLPAFQVNVFWHSRMHRDPANRWLRDVLFERFAE
jgi:DNA-binding transcriptional LysR family regulator